MGTIFVILIPHIYKDRLKQNRVGYVTGDGNCSPSEWHIFTRSSSLSLDIPWRCLNLLHTSRLHGCYPPAPSHPAVRLHKPAYQTAPDIEGGGGSLGEGGGGVGEKGGEWTAWIEEKETERETQGESAGINNQVTPRALQLLELRLRGTIVSGIACANL